MITHRDEKIQAQLNCFKMLKFTLRIAINVRGNCENYRSPTDKTVYYL
jgi:hypothetical protein